MNGSARDSENLENSLEIVEITSPSLVVGEINQLHARVWGADGGQGLDLVVPSIHADGCSSIDTCETVCDQVAFLSTKLLHEALDVSLETLSSNLDGSV